MRFRQWEQVIGQKEPPKTQTRWLVKENEYLGHASWTAVEDGTARRLGCSHTEIPAVLYYPYFRDYDPRMKWCVGKTCAVQRPDGQTMGRTPPVRAIRRERLGDISTEDVFAEGIGIYVVATGEWHPITILDVARELYARLWNDCYGKGAWERDEDEDVFVLDWATESETGVKDHSTLA